MHSTNQDYMLQLESAKKAAAEIRGCFTEKITWVKSNKLIQNMIDISVNLYDVERELIEKELFSPTPMKLIFLGKELNPRIEHELISDSLLGYKVTITFKEGSGMLKSGHDRIEVRNNCHEVHSLYHRVKCTETDSERIAFESNIHGTGGTLPVDEIESVVIEEALIQEENY